MIIIILILVLYVLPAIGAYKFHQYGYYHPQGVFYGSTPDSTDKISVFFPMINIVLSIMFLRGDWRDERFKKEITFFKPKKPFKNE